MATVQFGINILSWVIALYAAYNVVVGYFQGLFSLFKTPRINTFIITVLYLVIWFAAPYLSGAILYDTGYYESIEMARDWTYNSNFNELPQGPQRLVLPLIMLFLVGLVRLLAAYILPSKERDISDKKRTKSSLRMAVGLDNVVFHIIALIASILGIIGFYLDHL